MSPQQITALAAIPGFCSTSELLRASSEADHGVQQKEEQEQKKKAAAQNRFL